MGDLLHDVAGDGEVVAFKFQVLNKFACTAGGGADDVADAVVLEINGASGFVEALSFADRAAGSFAGSEFFVAAFFVYFGFGDGVVVGTFWEFPDFAEASAVGAPAVGGVEGEEAWVEFIEGVTAARAVHLRADDVEVSFSVEQAGGAFADFQGAFYVGGELVGFAFGGLAGEDVDGVFFVALEFLEALDGFEFAVNEEEVEAVAFGPGGDFGVVAFSSANEWGEDLDFAVLEEFVGTFLGGCDGAGGDGDFAFRTMLGAEFCEEESEEVVGFGDGSNGGFTAASGHALLDCDRGGESVDVVDIGFFELLCELSGVGRHAVEEASLAFGEEDVESEGGFSGATESGDDDHFFARDFDVDIFEIVFACALDADEAVVEGGGFFSAGGRGG